MQKKYLFTPNKLKYIKETHKNIPCILCGIVNKEDNVTSLEVYRSEKFIISVNLYPYNLGHLIIFPIRHIENIDSLSEEEVLELHKLQIISMNVNKNVYNASSFNIGYNIGEFSGASIKHLHLHVVPRYSREVGFLDVLNGTRVIVEDPNITVTKLKQEFDSLLKK